MLIRAILPDWAKEKHPELSKVREGEYNDEEISELNKALYNIYYLPNGPSIYQKGTTVDGSQIDTFNYVFVDMDLKDNTYQNKQEFSDLVHTFKRRPTAIVDSGNGVHVYWRISDLDAMTFLRLQRRLCRYFKTDEAVSKIYQLMRYPGSLNTKDPVTHKQCEVVAAYDETYSAEDMDSALPMITSEDEAYCQAHYNKTYNLEDPTAEVDTKIPAKFGALLNNNQEAKEIWLGLKDDRSKGDFRLGHIMLASGFTRAEAMSVLVNSAKAMTRAPKHQISYAENIVDQMFPLEDPLKEVRPVLNLSHTVAEILSRGEETVKGTRFPCYKWLDNTEHGFRLGHVIGLVAGSGVGKTAVALNMFMGFVESNPDYEHFFIPLEQPANEIADRWRTICGDRTELHTKVHVISNYDQEGGYRNLSFDDIKNYLIEFQRVTKKKIGCVVIDHIGVLKINVKDGENQGLMGVCKEMKAFAEATGTLLVMQSQTNREKAGVGDLELNKDAAYGTTFFENYCDYLITMWQPLKRCYDNPKCPTVTAFKFCKIRHKKVGKDSIKEDVRYVLFFDPNTGQLREMTEVEEKSLSYFNGIATNARGKDRKTDLLTYTSVRKVPNERTTSNYQNS